MALKRATGPTPLAKIPEYAAAHQLLDELRARAEANEKEITRLRAQRDGWRNPKEPKISALDQVKALIAGKSLDRRTVDEKLHAAEAEAEVLASAIAEQSAEVDRIATEASYHACMAVRDEHRSAMVAIYDAARTLSEAVETERRIRADLLSAGYRVSSAWLGGPLLAPAIALGHERDFGSAISRFRRALEQQGFLGAMATLTASVSGGAR